ncbi:MAG TPA: hypothetical protein VHF06_12250 [Pseudonocardiaceae bacterium]|jgi:hypothetical protein|nr:hypothetical protein [Pseudonocardiaceae bacterium]
MSGMKQVRGVVGLVGLAFGAWGAVKELRAARGKGDTLALVNAVLNVLAVVTGGALAIRGMREDKDGERS